MDDTDLRKAEVWQLKYKSTDFNPKLIFKDSKDKKEVLFALSFFLAIMSIEILFNQPFKKKIGIFHNNFYKSLFKKNYERLDRIELNSFGFSLFIILQKLFEEQETLKSNAKDIIKNVISHWSHIEGTNKKDFGRKLKRINLLWDENKNTILSRTYESRIDLIFSLYKSFEIGIGDKDIIKKNISVLIFSVSKAQKEFRYDVLNELKKKKI